MGLVNLLDLHIEYQSLTTLPANAFDGLPNLFKLTLEYNYNLQTIQSGAFNGLANLHEMEIYRSPLTSLQLGTFHGLYNLHKLDISRSALTSLQPRAFHGLYNLHELTIFQSALTSLHEGAFDGLAELDYLVFATSPLSNLAPGAFRGLSNLTYLVVNVTSITTLPPNAFAGLKNLEHLNLRHHHSLGALPPGVFNDLPKLVSLTIVKSALTTLPSGLFNGLSNLEWLSLLDNGALATVEPGAFTGLENLEDLSLSGSALTALKASSLRGLSNLEELSVDRNAIADISSLSSLTRLRELYLANNLISDVAPLVENAGLGAGDYVRLDGNPLSADALAVDIPALRRRGVKVNANAVVRIAADAQAEEGEPLVFPVALQPPQTSDVTVGWKVLDHSAHAKAGLDYPANQQGTLTLRAGAVTGSFSVHTQEDDLQEDDEGFTVVLRAPGSGLPDGLVLEPRFGVATILDDDSPPDANRAPQAISAVADVYTVVGTQTTLPVAGRFADPDGDALAVRAISSNPAVATAGLAGAGVVAIKAIAPGLAGVVVTAADPDGESAALTFAVRVSASPQAVVGAEDGVAVAMGDAVRVDLLAGFRALDDHALVFTAQSSNPAVATVRIRGNMAIIKAASEGSTRVVVTATDPTGQTRAVSFTVTIGGALSHSRLPAWLLTTLVGEDANEESQRE